MKQPVYNNIIIISLHYMQNYAAFFLKNPRSVPVRQTLINCCGVGSVIWGFIIHPCDPTVVI